MRWLVLTLCLHFIAACSDETPVQQQTVLQLHQDKQVRVLLSPADAPVEEILNLTVSLAEGWNIKQAEVTGLSMHMGTIPVMFNAVDGQPSLYRAEMVLGACSQPKMQWQLQLKLHHASHDERLLLLPFYSSWPE